jgi:uncharacterized protein (DUF58 family)
MKSRFHFERLFAYLVLFALSFGIYYEIKSYFFLLVMIFMITGPVFSIIGLLLMKNNIEIEMFPMETLVERGAVSNLRFKVRDPLIINSPDIKIGLITNEVFYGSEKQVIVDLPSRVRSDFILDLPMRYEMNGAVSYTVKEITILDQMGMIELKKNVDLKAFVNVIPGKRDVPVPDATTLAGGIQESEESVKRGHDFSDVSDVREYIPGDKLNSIHWKLSAKAQKLMVKDRVSMSDQNMNIIADLSLGPEAADQTVSYVYDLIYRLLDQENGIIFIWWNEKKGEFEKRNIITIEDLNQSFTDMYLSGINSKSRDLKKMVMRVMPELKSFVLVTMKDGVTDALVAEV